MPRDLLRAFKHVIQILEPAFVPLHMRLVSQTQLPANLRRSLFVTEQDHFHLWIQQLPALQRIPLNYSAVSLKHLRRREKSQHNLIECVSFPQNENVTSAET